jgi:hypothetical protein
VSFPFSEKHRSRPEADGREILLDRFSSSIPTIRSSPNSGVACETDASLIQNHLKRKGCSAQRERDRLGWPSDSEAIAPVCREMIAEAIHPTLLVSHWHWR